ncbi:MAG: type IV pilus assembly protein PilM [Planctomycetota bacterium]|nr:MAG: type IV pilus assembly protein PilM [Planctomycetota bacterium]
MLGRKKSVVGLDIGSSEVKALEFGKQGDRIVVAGLAIAKIESKDAMKETIREVIRMGNFKTKRVITAVSGRSVIMRYVNMLRMSDEDLHNAIRYEADKYIPFEVEETVLDCQRLEDPEAAGASDKEMKVLLVAVKRALIDEHYAMLQDVGVTPLIIDVDSFALGNAFELHNRYSPKVEDADRVVALIDIGANKTNINIVRGNTSYFTREVYLAGNDFTDSVSRRLKIDIAQAEVLKINSGERAAEVEECVLPTLDDLGNEIHLSFDYYENQFDREVDEVYISGGSSMLAGLDHSFERIFGRKVNFWNALENVEIRSDRVDQNLLQAKAHQFAVAAGLGARIDG